jgi:hypothetical protein
MDTTDGRRERILECAPVNRLVTEPNTKNTKRERRKLNREQRTLWTRVTAFRAADRLSRDDVHERASD